MPRSVAVEPKIGLPRDGPCSGGAGGATQGADGDSQGQGQDAFHELAEAAARTKSPKRTQGSMEDSGDWSMLKEADYVKVLADQEEKMEQLQAQLDLLTGKAMEFQMAEDACASLEMALSSMEERMRATTAQLTTEFRRLQMAESETRFKSNHFPTKDTREEWVQAAQNYKKGAEQILAFYQDTLNQRSQLASRLMRGV